MNIVRTQRITRDDVGIRLARTWAERGTCARRAVGCVLFDADGFEVGSGYNGPAAGMDHCIASPCRGIARRSGEGLDECEAIHAEANALLRCPDVRLIRTCYVTASPCVHCTKLLMNTGCARVVFGERYAHDEAAERLWTGSSRPGLIRTWESYR